MSEKLVYTVPPSSTAPTESRVVYLEIEADHVTNQWLVRVTTKDQLGSPTNHYYRNSEPTEVLPNGGTEAKDLILALIKANLATKSLPKRILERLVADGKVPAGAITGTPD